MYRVHVYKKPTFPWKIETVTWDVHLDEDRENDDDDDGHGCVCVLERGRDKDRQREHRKEGEAFLAVFQIVDDPGDGLLSCGANVTLQRGREGRRDRRDMGGGGD